jgi:hypothetical protein
MVHWLMSYAPCDIISLWLNVESHWEPCDFFPLWLIVEPHVLSQPHFEGSVRSPLTLPKMGVWSPLRLLKTQMMISGVKKSLLEVFLKPLERFWSIDVQNALAWAIWTSAAQVMGKRRAGSQIDSLTPNHKKSGINPMPTCARGVWYGVGKLSKRATKLVWTSSRSEVEASSYERPKFRESKPGQFKEFWDSTLGVPGKSDIRMRVLCRVTEYTIWGKVVASPKFGLWLTRSQVPCWTHLRVQLCRMRKGLELGAAPDF